MASPWSEDVLYSPDPPFLFGGGSGNETRFVLVWWSAVRGGLVS